MGHDNRFLNFLPEIPQGQEEASIKGSQNGFEDLL